MCNSLAIHFSVIVVSARNRFAICTLPGYYKRRRQVENFFQRIKEKRAIATRYEKLADRFHALVTLAAVCDWLR
jgi:transposase